MRTYAIAAGARYASILVQFLVVAIVTRILDQRDAGHYFVIIGVVWATCYAAGIGLPDGIVRDVPALSAVGKVDKAASTLRRGFLLSMATLPIGAVLCSCIVAGYLETWGEAIIAGGCWAAYGAIFIAAQTIVARGHGELGSFVFYSTANIGQLLITVPIILVTRSSTLHAVLSAVAVGTSISATVAVVMAWRITRVETRDSYAIREAWVTGLPIVSSRLVLTCLISSPVWIAAMVLGPSDAAIVALASRIASSVGALTAAIRFSIRPVLARDSALGDWPAIQVRASKVALLATTVATTAIAAVLTVGRFAVPWVFGSAYQGAALITALMLIGTVGESIGGPIDEVLKMAGYGRIVLYIMLASLIVGATVQFAASRIGGMVPLVLSYSAITVAAYLAMVFFFRKVRGLLILPRFNARTQ